MSVSDATAPKDSTNRLFCGTKSPDTIAKGSLITADGPQDARAGEGALLLLFARGQRPDARAFEAGIDGADRVTISHRFTEEASGAVVGFELLRDGMTYDLGGLAPGRPETMPPLRHRYGLDEVLTGDGFEAIALRPGPHLVAGARSMPVVRTMAGIAAALAPGLPGLRAIAWPPAGTLIGPGLFASSIAAWLAGGAFPALGLTAFADAPDGSLVSEGLAWFTGQELRIAPELAKDRVAAARLGVRLINQLVLQGRVAGNEAIVAPDGGRLVLEPTRDGRIVRVRRG